MLLAADDNFIFLPKQPSVKCLRLFLCGLDQGIKEETKWNKHRIPKLWFDYIFLKICEMIFFFLIPYNLLYVLASCQHSLHQRYDHRDYNWQRFVHICIQFKYIYSKLSYIENNSFEVYTFSHDNKEEVA